MNQTELRELIRELVRTGQLPTVRGGKTSFRGRGSNTVCDCCGQTIGPHDIEYEVEFTTPPMEPARSYNAHMQCHQLWWLESGPQNPPAAARTRGQLWDALRNSISWLGRSVDLRRR